MIATIAGAGTSLPIGLGFKEEACVGSELEAGRSRRSEGQVEERDLNEVSAGRDGSAVTVRVA